MGQAAFMGPMLTPRFPVAIAAIVIALPGVVVFTLTFFKQPFLPPRPFRLCLLLAMGWFALLAIFAEGLLHFGYLPPESPKYARTLARCLMHVGWLFFLPLARLYVNSRRFEAKQHM
jgi:hypothetical protein